MIDLNDSLQQRQCSALNDTTARNTVKMALEPNTPRQLGEEGLLVFWRDGADPGKREGLACILSMCPHPDCGCRDVYLDGYVVDANATTVRWDDEGVQQKLPTGSDATWTALDEKLFAITDPDSGYTRAHPDLADETDLELLDWLVSEMDGELLEVLHHFRARARGYPSEGPRTDIDLDDVEKYHLTTVDDLLEGTRSDEYVIGDHRYWAAIFLCPTPWCDCHEARIVFFDDEAEPGDDDVGSLLLDISGAKGFKIKEMTTEYAPGDTPEVLLEELWGRFQRRHDVGEFLRQREAQLKAVGETLWRRVAKPARAAKKIGRNALCPCGSGRKYKKCCLGKDDGASVGGDNRRK
jgi:hypothetical protein